jgi:DNA repair exonuclease SbcCD ATPase subunit
MNLEEKDAYIKTHLMALSAETLRFMVADLASEVEKLKAPVSMKDKITFGLQCQVAKIRELEEANNKLESLCSQRQKTIDRQTMRTKEWQALIDGLREVTTTQQQQIKAMREAIMSDSVIRISMTGDINQASEYEATLVHAIVD